MLAGGLGLRRSEALGARWSRVDWEKKTILLDTKIIEYKENGKVIVEPVEEMKNKSSRRTLPLPDPVYEMPVSYTHLDVYKRQSSCAKDPDRVQKAMIVCSSRTIAYELLKKFQEKYPEWFVEKKVADGFTATDEELKELTPMPFMAIDVYKRQLLFFRVSFLSQPI